MSQAIQHQLNQIDNPTDIIKDEIILTNSLNINNEPFNTNINPNFPNLNNK